MGKNVGFGPAAQVERAAGRQEGKTGFRQGLTPLADQHFVEPGLEGVQMQHVGGGVALLLLVQLGRTPIGGLLLLGELDPQQLLARSLRPWRSVKVRTSLEAILVQ